VGLHAGRVWRPRVKTERRHRLGKPFEAIELPVDSRWYMYVRDASQMQKSRDIASGTPLAKSTNGDNTKQGRNYWKASSPKDNFQATNGVHDLPTPRRRTSQFCAIFRSRSFFDP
jgi:hypothetical protein